VVEAEAEEEGDCVADAETEVAAEEAELEDGTAWYGASAGKLRGPAAWRCPRTGQSMRYLAARVADSKAPPPEEGEPVVLYLAGLGDAGLGKGAAPFRKRLEAMLSWGLPPFFFLAPLRTDGRWWVVEGEENYYGWLGEFLPSAVSLLADLVAGLAGDRPVVAIGFSAGAYCLTELLALGRPRLEAVAVGGLHGHGQPDLTDIPKKRQPGAIAKFKAYLKRLGGHPGVPGGTFAVHAEDDSWSPKQYARTVLEAIGTRNAERGCPRVLLTMLPAGLGGKRSRGHNYESTAIWRADLFRQLLAAASSSESRVRKRPAPQPRGSVMLHLPVSLQARECLADAGVLGATSLWLPEKEALGDVALAVGEEPAADGAAAEVDAAEEDASVEMSQEDFWMELWDDSASEVESEEGGPSTGWPEPADEAADDADAAPAAVVQDCNAATFDDGPEGDDGGWRLASALDMDEFQVQAKPQGWEFGVVPGWAERAAEIFKEHGFVVLLGALDPKKAARVLADCQYTAKQMVCAKRPRGNRHGGLRYSFGKASSTRSMLHLSSFARHLLDNWVVLAVLEAIHALDPGASAPSSQGTRFKCVSAGGDFVLAGEGRFQRIHSDLGSVSKQDNVHLPPPLISVGFCVEPISGENGPMRMVPGTQLGDPWLKQSSFDEPALWRSTRLFPLPVGAAIVRDVRTLHGGSPNFSGRARFLPAVEFASSRFIGTSKGSSYVSHGCLPRDLFKRLRPLTRARVSKELLAAGEVKPSFATK